MASSLVDCRRGWMSSGSSREGWRTRGAEKKRKLYIQHNCSDISGSAFPFFIALYTFHVTMLREHCMGLVLKNKSTCRRRRQQESGKCKGECYLFYLFGIRSGNRQYQIVNDRDNLCRLPSWPHSVSISLLAAKYPHKERYSYSHITHTTNGFVFALLYSSLLFQSNGSTVRSQYVKSLIWLLHCLSAVKLSYQLNKTKITNQQKKGDKKKAK